MGVYKSSSQVVIQRAYGKKTHKFIPSCLKNKNKFLLCRATYVLAYHYHVNDVVVHQINDQLNAYTKFMLKDMVFHGRLFGDFAKFTYWFNEKYLLPSRLSRDDMF
jgi:hypothetical protein